MPCDRRMQQRGDDPKRETAHLDALSRHRVAHGGRRKGQSDRTAWKVMLHLARHASPPVPGAMTSGIFLNSVKVDSGMPVAALSTELGIIMSDDQIVWVPKQGQSSISQHAGVLHHSQRRTQWYRKAGVPARAALRSQSCSHAQQVALAPMAQVISRCAAVQTS